MIEVLRPYIGVAFGAWLTFLGIRWTSYPNRYVGTGVIPATVPRTIRIFGVLTVIIGASNVAINIPKL